MRTYYVDATTGCDDNDGLSRQSPLASVAAVNRLALEPGDCVLFRCGSAFQGPLIIEASGAEGQPLIVSSYGAGGKPKILTEDGDFAVGLFGGWIELSSLEIVNRRGTCGLLLCSRLEGPAAHVYVRGCHIHDVQSTGFSHDSGGICVNTGRQAPTWYEDMRIENNVIENVCRSGIFLQGQWMNRKGAFWGANEYVDDEHGWYPHRDVYIGGNMLDHLGGDGIVAVGCVGLTMEYNRVFYANCNPPPDQRCASAGLWPMNSIHTVVQYNEVAYTGLEHGTDGQGYDIDNCSEDTVFQYNYSHHNAGGFLLLCNCVVDADSHHGTLIRNNLSVDDATDRDAPLFTVTGPMRDVRILNNTVYRGLPGRYRWLEVADYLNKGPSTDVRFVNNLFYAANGNCWNHFVTCRDYVMDSNVFYKTPIPDEENVTVADAYAFHPVLEAEGADGFSRETGRAYVPRWDSPLLRHGRRVEGCADRDFFGVDTNDAAYIGALYFHG